MPISEVYNEDNLIGMKRFEDKFWNLAICDPPYGMNIVKNGTLNTSSKTKNIYKAKTWDESIPDDNYFKELFRVSANQIIWGGNYFPILWANKCRGFIHWDKINHHENRADGEFAWTSFDRPSMNFSYMWDGNRYGFEGKISGVGLPSVRIHPIEKPIALYSWLLKNYAKPGDKILDTHMGSQSSRIAAYKLGFDYWGWEIDPDYFKQGCERFKKAISEPLFDPAYYEQQQLF